MDLALITPVVPGYVETIHKILAKISSSCGVDDLFILDLKLSVIKSFPKSTIQAMHQDFAPQHLSGSWDHNYETANDKGMNPLSILHFPESKYMDSIIFFLF